MGSGATTAPHSLLHTSEPVRSCSRRIPGSTGRLPHHHLRTHISAVRTPLSPPERLRPPAAMEPTHGRVLPHRLAKPKHPDNHTPTEGHPSHQPRMKVMHSCAAPVSSTMLGPWPAARRPAPHIAAAPPAPSSHPHHVMHSTQQRRLRCESVQFIPSRSSLAHFLCRTGKHMMHPPPPPRRPCTIPKKSCRLASVGSDLCCIAFMRISRA